MIKEKKEPDPAAILIPQIEEDIRIASLKKDSKVQNFTEVEAAEALNISVKTVKELRTSMLKAGVDYQRVEDGVRITEDGFHRLMEVITEDKNQTRLHRLIVEKITPNINILLARNPLTGDIVRVKVKTSKNWAKGQPMFIEKNGNLVTGCRHIDGDLYTYEFPSPRQKGRTF